MAKFMDVHSGFVGVTADQLREAHQRDLEIEAAEGVHFEHAPKISGKPSPLMSRKPCCSRRTSAWMRCGVHLGSPAWPAGPGFWYQ